MSTEIATYNERELEEFANSVGANSDDLQGGGDFLPMLKVNTEDEDANGKEIKKGLFFLTGQDTTVYAKVVKIRPLMQYSQWTKYDKGEKKTVNRTRMITSFKEEGRDEQGTIRCGKPPSKDLKANPELAEQFKNVSCYRHVYALVSYTGVDASGATHEVENVPAVLRLKGVNFNPFADEFIDGLPKNTKIWDFEATISHTKEKNGSVTYYILHFQPDFDKKLNMTGPIFETLKALKDRVDDTNREIDTKYYKALKAGNDPASDAAINALDITPNGLAADLEDEIPF